MNINISELFEQKEIIIKTNPNPMNSRYPNNLGREIIGNLIKDNFYFWLSENFFKTLTYSDRFYSDHLTYFFKNYDYKLFKNNFSNLTKKQKNFLLVKIYGQRIPLKKRFIIVDFLYQECEFKEAVNEYNHIGETIPMYETNKQIIQHILDNGYDLSIVKKITTSQDLAQTMIDFGWTRSVTELVNINKYAGLTAYELAVKLNYRSRLDLLKPKISYEEEEQEILSLLKLPTKKAFKALLLLIKQKNKAIKFNFKSLKLILKEKEPKSKRTLIHYLIDYNEEELLSHFIQLGIFDKNELTTIKHDYLFFSLIKMRPKCFKIILENNFFNEKQMRINFATYFESLENKPSYVMISDKTIQLLKDENVPLSFIQLNIFDNYESLEKNLGKKEDITEKRNTKI